MLWRSHHTKWLRAMRFDFKLDSNLKFKFNGKVDMQLLFLTLMRSIVEDTCKPTGTSQIVLLLPGFWVFHRFQPYQIARASSDYALAKFIEKKCEPEIRQSDRINQLVRFKNQNCIKIQFFFEFCLSFCSISTVLVVSCSSISVVISVLVIQLWHYFVVLNVLPSLCCVMLCISYYFLLVTAPICVILLF